MCESTIPLANAASRRLGRFDDGHFRYGRFSFEYLLIHFATESETTVRRSRNRRCPRHPLRCQLVVASDAGRADQRASTASTHRRARRERALSTLRTLAPSLVARSCARPVFARGCGPPAREVPFVASLLKSARVLLLVSGLAGPGPSGRPRMTLACSAAHVGSGITMSLSGARGARRRRRRARDSPRSRAASASSGGPNHRDSCLRSRTAGHRADPFVISGSASTGRGSAKTVVWVPSGAASRAPPPGASPRTPPRSSEEDNNSSTSRKARSSSSSRAAGSSAASSISRTPRSRTRIRSTSNNLNNRNSNSVRPLRRRLLLPRPACTATLRCTSRRRRASSR